VASLTQRCNSRSFLQCLNRKIDMIFVNACIAKVGTGSRDPSTGLGTPDYPKLLEMYQALP